jgi:ABC-type Mn2+/Zn2+ transport system ATPase subunit
MTETAIERGPVITCENIFVGYGSELVLRDVSLQIAAGMFVLLMGPNGAGKTTLLKAILGLLPLRRGQITTPFHVTPPGYVPQQKSIDPLYPITVRQIVSMGLYPELGPWGRVTGDFRRRVDTTLEQFDLLAHDRKTFAELSGGMRQKALIARAFVGGSEVFILDEPTSELDERAEREVVEHLHRLTRQQGKTVLLVHHGLGHAVSHGDLVCLVNHGKATLLEPDENHSMEHVADAARRGIAKGRAS